MSIRTCQVVAVDGTHSAGKTTLALALTAHYRERGVNAVYVADAARESPLIADVVIHSAGRFDMTAELDLIAATASTQIRAAHRHQLVVVDKTPVNVVIYARLLLRPEEASDPAWLAAERFCLTWQPYDLVVCCRDLYPLELDADTYRAKVTELQVRVDAELPAELKRAGYPVTYLPTGYTTRERVAWVVQQIDAAQGGSD